MINRLNVLFLMVSFIFLAIYSGNEEFSHGSGQNRLIVPVSVSNDLTCMKLCK